MQRYSKSSIVFWLLSISCNAYVYFPDRYKFNINSPTDILETTRDVNKKKNRRLKFGAALFIISLLLSSFSIIWLSSQKIPSNDLKVQNQTVQFVVSKDKIPILQNMSISFEKGTQRTNPLTLLVQVNGTFLVKTPEGKEVEFNEDLIEGFIYSNSDAK
jgi:hypothetical protein